jgi:hypothetical protein
MALYTVHAPKKADGAAVEPAELIFIKDGFCWPALFIPVIWLIYRRLWLTLLIYLVALFVLGTLAGLAGTTASTLVMVLFAFYFALEANGLRRWTVERRRHALIGLVEGRNRDEAEVRFFTEWPVPAEAGAPPAVAPPPPSAPSAPWKSGRNEPEIVGLFPSPGTSR